MQPLVQAQSKENMEAPRHWPPATGGFPTQRASNAEMFPFDEEIMTYLLATLSALIALCDGNLPLTRGFPSHRPVMQNFGNFFDDSVIKLLT